MRQRPTDAEIVLPLLVRDRAAAHPDRVLMRDADGGSLTYAEALDGGRRWAGGLFRLGVGPQDVVATMVPSSTTSFVVWQGIGWLRAWEAPLNEQYHGEFLAGILNDCRARVLVAHPGQVDRVVAIVDLLEHLEVVVVAGPVAQAGEPGAHAGRLRVVGADDLLGEAGELGIDQVGSGLDEPGPHDIGGIFYTSGTTGRSKGVLVPWGCVCAGGLTVLPPEQMSASDVIYHIGSASHTGSRAAIYHTVFVGATILVRSHFSVSSFWDDVDRHAVTTAILVGSMQHFVQAQPPRPDDASHSLRKVFMSPVVPDIDGFNRRFGVVTRTVYGMTEIGIPLCTDGFDVEDAASCGRVHAGFPWPEVRLVDEHDREVPPGQIGELIVRTGEPWTMNAGYLGNPQATATAWRNGWFHTGDAMRRDEHGRFYFVDRTKDAIRRRGENISSFEVEAIVNSHPTVMESAAVAVPSEYVEDEILIVVVPAEGCTVRPEEIADHVAARAPRFMVPRYVDVMEVLPKTPTLKVKKAELRARGLTSTTWDRQARG